MEILQRPDVELILVLSAAAVAAGAGAGSRAEKFRRIVGGRGRFRAQCDCRKRNPGDEHRPCTKLVAAHVRRRMERVLQPVRLLTSAATICRRSERGVKFPGEKRGTKMG